MISRLAGWSWELRADRVLLASEIGTLQYIERLRPLERVGDLVARHTAGLALHTIDPPEPLLTDEGELAALVEIEARVDGAPLGLVLGFVFGDDFYAYVEGRALPSNATRLASTVRDLVIADRHQLGVRRRRYLFRPPPWQGLTLGGAVAHYLAPAYPSDPTRITVFPAVPLAPDVEPIIDFQRALGEDLLVARSGPASGLAIERAAARPIAVASGLAGTRWTASGRWAGTPNVERDVVLLRDARFAYVLELVTKAQYSAAARTVFDAIVDSVQPIPGTYRQRDSGTAFRHWAE